MDLTRMSLHDLTEFQAHLRTIGAAAEAMRKGGLEPEISLGCEETVLRAAPVLSRGVAGPMPAPVLVEAADPAPVLVPDWVAAVGDAARGVADAGADFAAAVADDATPAPAVAVPAAATVAPMLDDAAAASIDPAPMLDDAAAASIDPAPVTRPAAAEPAGLVTGPLSEAERAEILRLDAAGVGRPEIAARLRRRVQAVALFLTAQIGADGQMRVAADRAPDAPAPAVTLPPEPVATFVRVADAAAPVVARAAAMQPDPLPGSVPDDLRGEDRKLWQHLARLPDAVFGPEDDLDMAEAFARGSRLADVALELEREPEAVKTRYKLLTATIRDDRDRLTIDGQTRLLGLLRRRMLAARGQVA